MNYTKIKVANLVNIDSGGAFESKYFNLNDGIPLVRIRNVSTGSTDTLYNGSHDDRHLIDNGDLLVTMDGEFIIKKWNGGKALLNQRVCRIRSICNKLDNKYLIYFLPEKLKQIEQRTSYVTVKHLSVNDIKDIEISLPPLEIQEKITDVLDKAQSLIDRRKEQIAKLDEFMQSVFLGMFGDPVKNPKGWEKVKLGEICNVYRGGSPRPIEKYLGGMVPWIKIGDATKGDNIYLHGTKECIIKEGVSKSRCVKNGSLIFANCGVSLGFARIINFDGCIHDGWLSLEDIVEDFNKVFLLKLLNTCTQYFRLIAPDGTQPNLNTTIMKRFEIILPPIHLQNKFAQIVEKTEQQKKVLKKSLSEMENLFNSLMQKAFRGDLFQ